MRRFRPVASLVNLTALVAWGTEDYQTRSNRFQQLHAERRQQLQGWSVRESSPRIWTISLAKFREHTRPPGGFTRSGMVPSRVGPLYLTPGPPCPSCGIPDAQPMAPVP